MDLRAGALSIASGGSSILAIPRRNDAGAAARAAIPVAARVDRRLGFDGMLYVADMLDNRIAAMPNALFRGDSAGTGQTVSQGMALNGPLGLAIAADGDILTVNGGDGNIVETTPRGQQVVVKAVDVSKQGGGTLFGLAIGPNGPSVYFVDDGNNTLNILK